MGEKEREMKGGRKGGKKRVRESEWERGKESERGDRPSEAVQGVRERKGKKARERDIQGRESWGERMSVKGSKGEGEGEKGGERGI